MTSLLAIIREALFELQKIASEISEKQFLDDKNNFAIAEHYLRRALEALFEISAHIISRFPMSPAERPDSYKGLAITLAGYRNRLVHEYDEVTPQEMYQIITTKLSDFELFAKAVVELMDQPNNLGLTVSQE